MMSKGSHTPNEVSQDSPGYWRAVLVLGVLLVTAGCVNPGRMADLADCGRLSVGVGLGVHASCSVGALTQPAVGLGLIHLFHPLSLMSWLNSCEYTLRAGHECREGDFLWAEELRVWPLTGMGLGPIGWGGGGSDDMSHPNRSRILESSAAGDYQYLHWFPMLEGDNSLSFSRLTDFEVSCTAIIPSARVGINPLEIIDFIGGFFGWDPADDDTATRWGVSTSIIVPDSRRDILRTENFLSIWDYLASSQYPYYYSGGSIQVSVSGETAPNLHIYFEGGPSYNMHLVSDNRRIEIVTDRKRRDVPRSEQTIKNDVRKVFREILADISKKRSPPQ